MKARWLHSLLLAGLMASASGCSTYKWIKEVKLVGFEEDVGKGKSVGTVEGGDCVFHILGYWLGGAPTISRAFANAQKQRTSSMADAVGGDNAKGDPIRYMNNVTMKSDGFNAVVFGKQCLIVSGLGYK